MAMLSPGSAVSDTPRSTRRPPYPNRTSRSSRRRPRLLAVLLLLLLLLLAVVVVVALLLALATPLRAPAAPWLARRSSNACSC